MSTYYIFMFSSDMAIFPGNTKIDDASSAL